MVVALYIDSTEKDLLQDVTLHSFWGQEIAGNKNPVSRSCTLSTAHFLRSSFFLLIIMWRKIHSLIGNVDRGGVELNGNLKPSSKKERTHLFWVNSPHYSTKWANLPPTDISGCGKIGSGKGWLSELSGRRGRFRGGELSYVTAPLRKVLFLYSTYEDSDWFLDLNSWIA